MRISSQSNQFIFNFPTDLIPIFLEDRWNKIMDKNFIPYDSPIDYISSTIKEISLPSISFETSNQIIKRGKKIYWKEAGNVVDKFGSEIDILFRSVDSFTNYFMIRDLYTWFYEDNKTHSIPMFLVYILDKDGNLIYTVLFKDLLWKNLSETRLSYNIQDLSEKTFTATFQYNWIDINWEIDNDDPKHISIFDIPITFKPAPPFPQEKSGLKI